LLELKSLTGEPVDSTWNELLLDVLTELVVKLELGLNILINLLIVIGWRLGWVEKVEERWSRNALLDNTGLLGVCEIVSAEMSMVSSDSTYSYSSASCSPPSW